MSHEIGFVMIRYVNSETTNLYWQECYRVLSKFYDWPIMIVDDNSDPAFLQSDLKLENTTIVHSKFKRRGEILAAYYFHKLKPFKSAVILHDSMYLTKRFEFANFDINRPLISFEETEYDEDEMCESFIKLMDNHEELLKTYRNKNQWLGAFGIMMYVDWDFLDLLNKRYDLFDALLANIDARKKREQVERIFGCLFQMHGSKWPHVFGKINLLKQPTFAQYKAGYISEPCYVKVFTGR